MSQDIFHSFFKKFEKGEALEALQLLLPTPETHYEEFKSKNPLFWFLQNGVDASVYGTPRDAFHALAILQGMLGEDEEFLKKFPNSYEILANSARQLQGRFKGALFTFEVFPKKFQNYLSKRKEVEKAFNSLKAKPENLIFDQGCPWFLYTYPVSLPEPTHMEETPLIFLEPLQGSFHEFLKPYQGKPAVFVFENKSSFFQMLQFEEVVESLKEENHQIYILDIYPQDQFLKQVGKSFKPVFAFPIRSYEGLMNDFVDAYLKKENDRLYQISKKMIFNRKQQRLGIERAAALNAVDFAERWYDPHKVVVKDLPSIPDYFEKKLSQLSRLPVRTPKKEKIRLAHIVPQVVDGSHAPSQLLENLFTHHDQKKFELFLISTERLTFHPQEYPFLYVISPPSQQRGKERITRIKERGVQCFFIEDHETYEKSARDVAKLLKENKVDIAIFHGPDVINGMAAAITDVPQRVLFEHGTMPSYPGFEKVLVSSEQALDIYKDLFSRIGTKAFALPFAVNLRASWEKDPYPKKEFGISEDNFIMTTISHYLEARLSQEMCSAISEILIRCPKAVYAPMGPVEDPQKLLKFFDPKITDRIKFLGPKNNPSQCARSMQLYLNEFPFGSCLGILDAMAAGCPVVTMYDENGPQQGRYGGVFMGKDRAITSKKVQDYVQLACKLIKDPKFYAEWSTHAKKQYEKFTDLAAYTKKLEEII